MSEKLKPCPFCGRQVIGSNNFDGDYFLVCLSCYATGPAMRGSRKGTRKAWNRRAEPKEVTRGA